jgi:uncharacterized protein
MTVLALTVLLFLGSLLAGLLGALTGLGGGVVIVPLLTLVFGVDLRYAIGASLVSVIATSSGAASAYVREGYSNVRVGMFLEVATTLGALGGAVVAAYLPGQFIAILFGVVLLVSAGLSNRRNAKEQAIVSSPLAEKLNLPSSYPGEHGLTNYGVRGVSLGFSLMTVAGALSGLLGIGSGAVKVLAMDAAMGLPFKVSTTTSNLMIGVTAAASAGVYLSRGYIDPVLSAPVMLGVLCGALLGARILMRVQNKILRWIFTFVIIVLGVQMIYNGITGRL